MGILSYAVAGGGFAVIGAWEVLDSSNLDSNPYPDTDPSSLVAQISPSPPKSVGPSSVSVALLSSLFIANSIISFFSSIGSRDRVGSMIQLQILAVTVPFLVYAVLTYLVNSKNAVFVALPSSITTLILLFGFIEEFLMFYLQKKDVSGIENRYYDLMLVPIAICVFSTVFELKSDANTHRFAKLGRGIGLILQGTWFLQMGLSFFTDLITNNCSFHENSRGNFTIKCKGRSDYHRAKAIATLQFNCHLALMVVLAVGLFSVLANKKGYIPKACLKRITQMCTRFLWRGDVNTHTIPKVSWRKICLPKVEGGLGLRDFLQWNKVLNLKLIWILFSKSGSLWVAWNNNHRLRTSCFWSVEPKDSDSSSWKTLLRLRPLARKFLKCKLGDGHKAKFWFDDWSVEGPLIIKFGSNAPQRFGILNNATVAQVFSLNQRHIHFRRPQRGDADLLMELLRGVNPPSSELSPDLYQWEVDSKPYNIFSAKKTWDTIRYREQHKSWASAVWFRFSVPRHSFNFWTANLNRLPMRARMASWGVNISDSCCVCSTSAETRDHLFLWCPLAEYLWTVILTRLGEQFRVFASWDIMVNWLNTSSSGQSMLLRKLSTQALVYIIWRERNERLHNGISTSHEGIFKQLDRCIRDTLLARLSTKGNRNILSQWFKYS